MPAGLRIALSAAPTSTTEALEPPGGQRLPSTAAFSNRAWGALVDMVAALAVATLAGGVLVPFIGGTGSTVGVGEGNLAVALLLAITSFAPAVYLAVGWRTGGTVGLRVTGTAVIDAATGGPPAWDQVVRRVAILMLPSWMALGTVLLALAGLIIVLGSLCYAAIDPEHRALHDIVAGTAVIDTRRPSATVIRDAWTASAPETGSPRQSPVPWTWTDVVPVIVVYFPLGVATATVLGRLVNFVHTGPVSGVASALLSTLLDVIVDSATLALLVLLVVVRRHSSMRSVGWRSPDPRWIVAAVGLGFGALRLESVLGLLSDTIFPHTAPEQCESIRESFGSTLPLALLAVAVIAPVFEETVFRGFLYQWLRGRVPVAVAIVVSAAIFSAGHFGYGQVTLFLPIFGTGLVLATIFQMSRSLWACVVVHATINLVATLALFATGGGC